MSKILFNRKLILLLIIINSGVIFLTDNKRAGFSYLREAYLAILFAYSFATLFLTRRSAGAGEWVVFLSPVCLMFLSAGLANYHWGQPFFYGLFEERRFLSYLIFFPIIVGLRNSAIFISDIEKYVLYTAIGCAVVGFLYSVGIIPESNPDFKVDRYTTVGNSDVRAATRFPIGVMYLIPAITILLLRLRDSIYTGLVGRAVTYLALAFLLSYLWFVVQTRSVMLMCLITAAMVFIRRPLKSAITVAAFALAIAMIVLIAPEALNKEIEKFNVLLNDALQDEPSVRDITTNIILENLTANSWMGMGALSLQWNEGFLGIFNDNFYLSDVGIFGFFFRFGFLGFILLPLYYFYVFKYIRMGRSSRVGYAFYTLTLLGMLNIVYSNTVLFGGGYVGIAIAIGLFSKMHSHPPHSN